MKIGTGVKVGTWKVGSMPFSPIDVSNLALWFDAADRNTMFDATTGGNSVYADGTAIRRWEDKSGNNRHVISSIGNNTQAPPIFKTNIKNGLSIADFTGSKFLGALNLTSSFAITSTQGCALFAVFKHISATSDSQYYGPVISFLPSGLSSTLDTFMPILREAFDAYPGSQNDYLGANPVSFSTPVSVSNNTWGVASGVAQSGATQSNCYLKINNTTSSIYASQFGINVVNGNSIFLGSQAEGNSSTPSSVIVSSFFDQQIGEILFYRTVPSATQITQIQNYLNAKWAVY